jgi:hypothetical protein
MYIHSPVHMNIVKFSIVSGINLVFSRVIIFYLVLALRQCDLIANDTVLGRRRRA